MARTTCNEKSTADNRCSNLSIVRTFPLQFNTRAKLSQLLDFKATYQKACCLLCSYTVVILCSYNVVILWPCSITIIHASLECKRDDKPFRKQIGGTSSGTSYSFVKKIIVMIKTAKMQNKALHCKALNSQQGAFKCIRGNTVKLAPSNVCTLWSLFTEWNGTMVHTTSRQESL